jgi:hypothetical protein
VALRSMLALSCVALLRSPSSAWALQTTIMSLLVDIFAGMHGFSRHMCVPLPAADVLACRDQ